MEQARIAVLEDSKEHQEIVIASLLKAGHAVVAIAGTMEEAYDVIDDAGDGLLDIDAITIDGNFCHTRHCGTDAKKLFARMEERGLDCLFIGNSGHDLDIPLDANVPKMATHKLGQIVTRLMLSSKPHVLQGEHASHQDQNAQVAV